MSSPQRVNTDPAAHVGRVPSGRYPLEPELGEREQMGALALAYVNQFIEGLEKAPTFHDRSAVSAVPRLLDPPGEAPGNFDALLAEFATAAETGQETGSPGSFGYVPGSNLYSSLLADLLARTVNRYTGLAAPSLALAAMEQSVIGWLCKEFGLPETSGGLVTTGGSVATLSAIVAARHDRLGENFFHGTIYVSTQTHHCVAKAARIAGLPSARVRLVPVTEELRLDVAALTEMVRADRKRGLRPFLVVANAGTTNSGTVDPLPQIGELARREDMWLHVDAAYGGFFQLTSQGRERLAGISAADSIVLDPHKGMFVPYGTGTLLVRELAPLRAAHSAGASYLQDLADGENELPNFHELGPELTRDFRGLRLWLPLHLHGVAAFRDALAEKLQLAGHFYRELSADPRFELPHEPDLSIVVFRLRDRDASMQRALLERCNASGRIFLSSTQIAGQYTLRLCVLNLRTHADRVDEAVEIVKAAARF